MSPPIIPGPPSGAPPMLMRPPPLRGAPLAPPGAPPRMMRPGPPPGRPQGMVPGPPPGLPPNIRLPPRLPPGGPPGRSSAHINTHRLKVHTKNVLVFSYLYSSLFTQQGATNTHF
mgnify:CR=1 FL=1